MTSPALTAPMTATQRTTDRSLSVTTPASCSRSSVHLAQHPTNRLGRRENHPLPITVVQAHRTRAPRAEPRVMTLNWERLARSAMHPLKVAVLEALENGEASPRNLADELTSRASVSFHVRTLRNAGLIELA